MTATAAGCVHPSGRPAPVRCERYDYQSHVHDGVVLRLCTFCGEPDWAAFAREVDRLVKARMAAIAVAVLADLQGLPVTSGSHDGALSVTRRLLAAALDGFWLNVTVPAGTDDIGTGLRREVHGEIADADRVAEVLHATLSRMLAQRQDPP